MNQVDTIHVARVPSYGRHGALRVLLVEDCVALAESTRMVIELMGHEVRVASDGHQAIETGRSFLPDVLLCDIGLPGSLDGHAVARAFRDDEALSSCNMVALTGAGLLADRVRAADAGFSWYLLKPIDVSRLERLLESLWHARR